MDLIIISKIVSIVIELLVFFISSKTLRVNLDNFLAPSLIKSSLLLIISLALSELVDCLSLRYSELIL